MHGHSLNGRSLLVNLSEGRCISFYNFRIGIRYVRWFDGAMSECTSPLGSLKKAAFFGQLNTIETVYAQGRREKIAGLTELYPSIIDLENFQEHAEVLSKVEVVFSTWGMPLLTPEHLDQLPSLKAVFYGAGSVQSFAAPLLDRGIVVMSAWQSNAIPVAEFTVAQILLATKGYFRNATEFKSPKAFQTGHRGRGNFGETIALLGAGAIGRKVIELLRPFHLKIIVFDPFLSEDAAAELGVEKVSIEAAFERGYVVSNHLANLPSTEGMLKGEFFARMRENAVFINTGRGITVDEKAMTTVLQSRLDLTALLDVTWPEPPPEESILYSLPNVHLSTHIAGSLGDEIVRMADYCIEEFLAWSSGLPLRYAVSFEMLKTMA